VAAENANSSSHPSAEGTLEALQLENHSVSFEEEDGMDAPGDWWWNKNSNVWCGF
jgi:hypothetical protein